MACWYVLCCNKWGRVSSHFCTLNANFTEILLMLFPVDDGMKMQGYNGSQLWDTTFWVQAVCESGLGYEFQESLNLARHYLDITQVCVVVLVK